MLPNQNISNPFATKFACHFWLKPDVSKLQATLALAKLIEVEIPAALYLMQNTHVLSFLDSECFRVIHLTLEETRVVDTALSPFFDLSFCSTDTSTVEFGNFLPWRPVTMPFAQ